MHFALLREHVRNELGRGPEDAFAEFDPHAFAAASIGQVHRARLVTGETLAVKVQYPGIGRAIRTDFRSISALLLPLHLSKGWNRIKAQVEDVRKVIDMETDYEREAEILGRARALFAEDDSIVVPRVYPEFSTRRVLTMQFLEGHHVQDFLAPGRTQEERDHFGRLIYLAQSRLHYAGKMLYADPSPGNFLFLPDGRLGFIDFGCVRPYNDSEWNLNRLADAGSSGGAKYAGPAHPRFRRARRRRGRTCRAPGAPQVLVSLDVAPVLARRAVRFRRRTLSARGRRPHGTLLQRAIHPGRSDVRLHHPLVSRHSRAALPPARASRRSTRFTRRNARRRDGREIREPTAWSRGRWRWPAHQASRCRGRARGRPRRWRESARKPGRGEFDRASKRGSQSAGCSRSPNAAGAASTLAAGGPNLRIQGSRPFWPSSAEKNSAPFTNARSLGLE